MKITTIQNTYIEAEIVLADRRLKAGETAQLRCVLDSKLGPVYLTEKLTVDEYKSTSNDTYCRWNYVLQEKCILPGTYNFEIVVVQSSGLVIPVSSKAENCLIIVPAERGECFLKPPEKMHIMPYSGDVGTMRVNNPEYVDQMIAVAKSYYIKDAQYFKDTGRHFFNYHQSYTCMDNAFGYQSKKPYIWADREKASDVRREHSKPIAENNFLDCSSFINLVLRGIPYDCSPYALEKAKREDWDRTVLVANKGVYSWAKNPFEWYMHKAEINPFWDDEDAEYAQTQYSSVRYKQDDRKTPEIVTVQTADKQKKYEYYKKAIPRDSANLGKLLASQGGTVFFKDDFCNVEPGDIILYSSTNPDANPHNDGYKYITHIAICGSKEPVAESDSDYERFRGYPYKHRIYDATYASGLVSEIKDEKGNTVDYDVPTFIQYIPITDENGNVVDVISERYLELDSEEIVAIVRPDLTGTAWGKKRLYPTLTDTQKKQIQDLIVQYSSVRQTLFYYTGAVRRESYVSPACITNTGYSTDTQLGCVYKFQNDELDKKIYTANGKAVPDKTDRYYYKYMLNCGLFCQFIWMGRPISDFVAEGEGLSLIGKDYDLLYYVGKQKIAPVHHTLQASPANISKKINSVFGTGKGETPWGYYFNFELSKRMYKAKNADGDYYTYNSFFNYKNEPVVIEVAEASNERYTITQHYGKVTAHPLTNQVIVDRRIAVKINQPLDAGAEIVIGTITKYVPDHTTALAVYHPSKMFTGVISTNGKISIRCSEALAAGTETHYISVNASYSSPSVIEAIGTKTPLGFDGAANMAEELYGMGCEVPYSEIDVGDLVFFKSSDISNDFRNRSTDDDDDAMINRLFRHISHVGIVREFDIDGYPVISDCTNAYEYPIVIGRTSMGSDDKFSRVKASYERNNVVMVARHPAAFGLGGNVPAEFEPYRGILV